MDRARAFAIACGKGLQIFRPGNHVLNLPLPPPLEIILEVTVSKDVPGFVSNALLMPFINEVTPFLMRIIHYTEHEHPFSISQAIMCLEKVIIETLSCALLTVCQGTATREDIDTTLKLGMNHPMGPLQLGKL